MRRHSFVPECSGLEFRLSLSVAGTTPVAAPPAATAPTPPPPTDPGDGSDPGDGGNVGIKPYPTSGGSGGVNPGQ